MTAEADKIWGEIKNDRTTVYQNQTMLDVFLSATDSLKLDHFLELSKTDRNKINGDVVSDLLLKSNNRIEIAKILGRTNLDKLDPHTIVEFLITTKNIKEMAEAFGEILNKLSEYNVYSLIFGASNTQTLMMVKALGKENLKKLRSDDIYHLIRTSDDPMRSYTPLKMASALGKEILNSLINRQIYDLIRGSKDRKRMVQALGKENIDKLLMSQREELGIA